MPAQATARPEKGREGRKMIRRVTMPFGKWKGHTLDDIPVDYLIWVLDNVETLSPFLRDEIERHLRGDNEEYSRGYRDGFRAGQVIREQAPRLDHVKQAVQKWHREVSLRFHPDRGGDARVMRVVNELRDSVITAMENR
jgi:hypothetical protein